MTPEPTTSVDDFDAATLPQPQAGHPGRYAVELSPRWNAPMFPQGGVVSAAALRAMEHALGNPRHTLHSSTTVFASTVAAGRAEIDVEVLRAGRRMSHCAATVRNPDSDDAGHRITAIFGEARDEAVEFTQLHKPVAPAPESCPLPEPPPEGFTSWPDGFFNRVELRRVKSFHVWEEGWKGGEAESIRWLRFREPARDERGLLPLWGLLALSDSMPNAVGQYLGPGGRRFMAPSCDLTMHYFEQAPADEFVLLRNRCRHAARGYASADNEIWSMDGRLLAYATQTMLLRLNLDD